MTVLLLISLGWAQEEDLPIVKITQVPTPKDLVWRERGAIETCFSAALTEHFQRNPYTAASATVLFFVDDDGYVRNALPDSWSWELNRPAIRGADLRPSGGATTCLKSVFTNYRVMEEVDGAYLYTAFIQFPAYHNRVLTAQEK